MATTEYWAEAVIVREQRTMFAPTLDDMIDTNVLGCVNETHELLPAVDRVTEMFGEKPENMLTDGGNAAGSVLDGLEQREITAFAPAKSSAPAADSPVLREDLTQPVPEELLPKLKLNDKKRLDKSCFVYDAEQDHYVCPMGRVLERKDSDTRNGVLTVRYESLDCSGCPLAAKCLMKSENPDACRQVRRDEHEDVRERTAARMATEAGREKYDKRLSLNMKKLVRYIRRIRQEIEELLDAAPDSDKRTEKCPAGA